MMRMIPWIPLLVGLAGCGLGAADGERSEVEESEERTERGGPLTLSEEAAASLELRTAPVVERTLAPNLEARAELRADPDRHAEISPPATGRVIEVRARPGETVARGAPVVILESPEVGFARAEYLSTAARAEVSRAAFEREAKLLEQRATSAREFQEAEGALKVAEADLAAARAKLAALGAPVEPSGEVAASARLVLTSPIAGVVTSRSVHVGQTVQPGDSLVEVVDLSKLWLIASVYEREMRHVATGQPVEVEIRAWPGEVFEAVVDQVGGALDEETRSVPVRVVLENPDHRLRPGMFGSARLGGTEATGGSPSLVVPWSAVQEIDGTRAVFVDLGGGSFELRRVHTGERVGQGVQVLAGLAAGEEVVSEGSFLLKGELLKSTLGEDE